MASKNDAKWSLEKPEIFSQVFQNTHMQVFHYLYGLTGGPISQAEDLLAETFIRAWRFKGRFRGEENTVIFWLFRIARNQVLDAYRRNKSRGVQCALENEEIKILSPMDLLAPSRAW